MMKLGCTVFDVPSGSLHDASGAKIALRGQAVRVLDYLVKAQGELVTKEELIKEVWSNLAVTDDSLVQCIGEIRNAIGDKDHELLKTEHRRGYRLVAGRQPSVPGANPSALVEPDPVHSESNPVRAEPVEAHASADRVTRGFIVPAIAVMPFTSTDGDEHSERLARTFASELTSELARHKSLRIVSRVSAFSLGDKGLDSREISARLDARFIVSGQVQQTESGLQWMLEMVDTLCNETVWSEQRLVPPPADAAESAKLHWRLAGTVNHYFRRANYQSVSQCAALQPEDSLNAFELVTRIGWHIGRNLPQATRKAQQLAAMAVERFPQDDECWRALAQSHSFDMHSCHTGEWGEGRTAQALTEIGRAVDLGPTNPRAFAILAFMLMANGELDEALLASDRSLVLGRADPDVLQLRGVLLMHAGRWHEARAVMDTCMTVVAAPASAYFEIMGRIHLALGEMDQAIHSLQEAVTVSPGSIARMSLVVALEEKGEHQKAAQHFATLMTHTNGLDEAYFGRRFDAIPDFRDRCLKALRVHGLKSDKTSISEEKVPLSLVKRA